MQGSVLNAKFELLTIYSSGSKKSFRADIFFWDTTFVHFTYQYSHEWKELSWKMMYWIDIGLTVI